MTGRNVVPFASSAEPSEPPNNVEAEQALLGALMLDNSLMPVVSGIVDAEHFYWRDHQEVFTCISDLIAAGRPATPITVKGYLEQPEIAGEPAIRYLSHISSNATTTINGPGYAAIVKDMATRRALKAFGEEIAQRAQCDPVEATGTALLERAETVIHDMRLQLSKADSPHLGIRALNRHLMESITTVRSGTGAPIPTSGFPDIDKQLGGGLRPGRLMVFAGRPGMGKTILGLAFARHVAESGVGAALYSLEIDGDELGRASMPTCSAGRSTRSPTATSWRPTTSPMATSNGSTPRCATSRGCPSRSRRRRGSPSSRSKRGRGLPPSASARPARPSASS
jgi:replicative DNA helicase